MNIYAIQKVAYFYQSQSGSGGHRLKAVSIANMTSLIMKYNLSVRLSQDSSEKRVIVLVRIERRYGCVLVRVPLQILFTIDSLILFRITLDMTTFNCPSNTVIITVLHELSDMEM